MTFKATCGTYSRIGAPAIVPIAYVTWTLPRREPGMVACLHQTTILTPTFSEPRR